MPVTVFPGPLPGTTHIHVKTVLELKLQQSACSGTHQTRLLFIFRREGIRVDRSAINLDTSTESRSPVKNFGRFSFRGPCRLARKMAVRNTRLTCTPTPVKTYPTCSGHFLATTRALVHRHNQSASHGHVGAAARCAPCPQDHNPPRPRVLAITPPPNFFNFHRFVLKPPLTSRTIRPTDGAHREPFRNPARL